MNKIKDFLNSVLSWLKNEWVQHKAFILAALGAIVAIKFREILISLIVNSGKQLGKDTEKKDQVLKSEESAANNQANALVEKAKVAGQANTDADLDWNKKKE